VYKSEYINSWALIIGVNKYLNVSSLNYAVSDAESIAKLLKEKFNFPKGNITVLIDENSTRNNIMRSLLGYSKDFISPDDKILVFFAGHGYTISGRRGEVGYLVPVDGNLYDLSTLIRWDELTINSEIIKAKHIFFIMDACYGGLAITRSLNTGSMRFLKSMLQRYSRQVLTAGKADEKVADSGGPTPRHSIFTSYLLEALEGNAASNDGVITANNVMGYVYDKVSKDLYSQQTPHFGYLDGDGDFIFEAPILKSLKGDIKTDKDTLIEIESKLEQSINSDNSLLEEVKEYISDDRYRIKLEDIVNQEIRTLITLLNEENFPLNIDFNPEILAKRLKKYEDIVYNLQGIIISLTRWGKEYHKPIIKNIVARITEQIQRKNGNAALMELRWYPSILLIYSGGISSIASGNYDNLLSLFNTRIISYEGIDEEVILQLGSVITKFEQMKIFKKLPDHERYYVARSEYTLKILQPIFDDLLFLGKSYERLFDYFEIFLALVHADYYEREGRRAWGPVGRFGWKERRDGILKKFFEEANLKKNEWPPIKAGFFNSSFDRFKEIFDKYYNDIVSALNWF